MKMQMNQKSGSKAVFTKQLVLFVYALISIGLAGMSLIAPQEVGQYFSIWLFLTFSLWLYLFLTMIRLLCDLQSLQKMREELYELRYQEILERLAQFRHELRKAEQTGEASR